MADVVLHYDPGSAAGLSSLLERTERLLESFPCRTPPVFSPWFPAAADRHPPIRPARPAPVIVCPAGSLVHQPQEPDVPGPVAERCHDTPAPENSTKPEDGPPERAVAGHKDGASVTNSPLKRSWSVFSQRVLQTESLSKPFRHAVSVHRLHLHQRAKWVIGQHNCGEARDIEQVWRALSRCSRSSGLPTCNANIRRERVEIWVFCDVVHSERVGRFLKEELQLSGGIELSVHGRGNVFIL
ncbi:shieldin complex subunit 3 [Cyclopterus lumpus]|uniref:Shieldin complex subunit 3 n=1 Tax=Cyclopterus lumpus TaxID=8103 RepID=A0A8C2Z3K3_CYCLU|nr:shieldin complex subunit 3 [Cyclopterus lumpus]XP_034396942.1 shieldin complex subunit 3 [Cyclopterus lumpus]